MEEIKPEGIPQEEPKNAYVLRDEYRTELINALSTDLLTVKKEIARFFDLATEAVKQEDVKQLNPIGKEFGDYLSSLWPNVDVQKLKNVAKDIIWDKDNALNYVDAYNRLQSAWREYYAKREKSKFDNSGIPTHAVPAGPIFPTSSIPKTLKAFKEIQEQKKNL